MDHERGDPDGLGGDDGPNLHVVLYRADGTRIGAWLTELTYDGCRMLCDEAALEVGERLMIALPKLGQIKAQVHWVEGDLAGARFVLEEPSLDERRAGMGR